MPTHNIARCNLCVNVDVVTDRQAACLFIVDTLCKHENFTTRVSIELELSSSMPCTIRLVAK